MSATVQIQGFSEATAVLAALPDKLQAQALRKMFTKAARPLIADAKSKLLAHDPNYKKLASAIGVIPVRTNDPVVVIGVRAKGKFKDIGFIGHWVEYGVSGIKSKTSKTLTKPEDESYRFWVARVKKGERYRHDIPPQPFLRPAIDAKRGSIAADVKKEISAHISLETERLLSKHGGWGAAYQKAKGRS